MISNDLKGILAGLAAASIWGGMYVVSKVVLDIIPPFGLLSLRLLLGAACLGLIVAWRGRPAASRVDFVKVGFVGLIGFGVSLGLQFVGTRLSTAANASLVTSASPAFMVSFAALILGERLTWRRLTALSLATVGVLAVIDPRTAEWGIATTTGNLILLAAALTWGLYSVLVKRASSRLNTMEVSLLGFLGGLPLALSAASVEVRYIPWGRVTVPVVLGVLYLGLVSTALAMYLWNTSLATLEAGVVSILFFAQPVVGAGLGSALLKEELKPGFWVGAVLIGFGVLFAARSGAVGEKTIQLRRRKLEEA